MFLTTAQVLLMLSKEDQVERRKMGKVFRMKKSGGDAEGHCQRSPFLWTALILGIFL